ncbi:MAG: Acetyltransferase domain [Proteobacteria bacterium]|nr:Acetyltransferase domain [Pseudomonadota bacterium]
MPPPELIIETLAPEHYAALARMLGEEQLLVENAPMRSMWQSMVDEPFRQNSVVLVARRGDCVEGVMAAGRRPFYQDCSQMLMFWVRKGSRRQGIGRALKAVVGTALRQQGVPRMIAGVPGFQDDVRQFLLATDFVHLETSLVMGAGDKIPSVEPVPGFSCRHYTGGDAAFDSGIAELMNKAFVNEGVVPPTSGEMLADILDSADSWMIVAVEEKTGSVVGYSECTDSGFFSSIAVARRHWGSSLADWIAALSLERLKDCCKLPPWALVRPNNRASIALMERFGWQQVGTCEFYAAPA